VGLTLPALEINTIHMRAKQNYVVYYVLLLRAKQNYVVYNVLILFSSF